jgi:uncharacterized protein DUF4416
MSHPQAPKSAKLIIGIFLNKRELFDNLVQQLCDSYGPVDGVSPWLPFDFTSYYGREMGTGLERRMVAFENLIQQTELSDIKLFTNQLEAEYTIDGKRQVNIDPGYLLLERFVLATGKNFAHRIYLDKGIYADLTLIFTKGCFQTLPWTYPDYAQDDIQQFLLQIRQKYFYDLKKLE